MSAFNWIIIQQDCPSCGQNQTILCQTHMASSINGTDKSFYDEKYHIGEKMRWWPQNDPQYISWKQGNYIAESTLPDEEDKECCYCSCSNCKAELYAVIDFRDCTPIKLLGLGLEENWPGEFYK